MSNIKFVLLFLFFVQVSSLRRQKQTFEPYSRFKSVKCHTSNITVVDFKCFIKANSRRNTTLNMIANITRPVFTSIGRYDFRSKSISNSQRSIINATVDLCSFLNGTKSNPVAEWILGMMPELKKLIHPCPYQVIT